MYLSCPRLFGSPRATISRSYRSFWARIAQVFLPALLILISAPFLHCSVTVEAPSPPLPLQRNARVSVVYDGKPSPDITIQIQSNDRRASSIRVATDSQGVAILPDLPPGRYWISTEPLWIGGHTASLFVCLVPCADDGLEIIHFAPTTLAGPLRVLDRDDLALSEIRIEIGPAHDPDWRLLLSIAGQQQITNRMPEFYGVVQDRSGAVIPGAWIDVVEKGTDGKKHATSLHSDREGRFSAQLPAGDYEAFIQSPGFKIRVMSFTIAPEETMNSLRIILDVGDAT